MTRAAKGRWSVDGSWSKHWPSRICANGVGEPWGMVVVAGTVVVVAWVAPSLDFRNEHAPVATNTSTTRTTGKERSTTRS